MTTLATTSSFLLHVCCAPCSLPIIERWLSSRPFLFFSGSNIFPREEYFRRRQEVEKVAALFGLAFFDEGYDHEQWLSYVKEQLAGSLASYPENRKRCQRCFQYRLKRTAEFAKEKGWEEFGVTLSVSRFKDIAFINDYGKRLGDKYQLVYRTFPLTAEEAYRRGLWLSRKYNIYRQKYCGCEFSLRRGS